MEYRNWDLCLFSTIDLVIENRKKSEFLHFLIQQDSIPDEGEPLTHDPVESGSLVAAAKVESAKLKREFNRKWTGTFSKTCNSKKAIRKMCCISAASYAERKIQREKKPQNPKIKK